MYIVFAALPIILLLFLVLGLRWTIIKSAGTALALLIAIAIWVWEMPLNWLAGAGFQGLFLAIEIALILFGALFFLQILNKNNFQQRIKKHFQQISNDKRVQLVIIGFAFTALIEASAGFGVPAMLAAPLLVILGFPLLSAVSLSLIGAALPTIFGAVGLPIILGFKEAAAVYNISLSETGALIAFLNIFQSFVLLLIMQTMLIFLFGSPWTKRIKYVLDIIPYLIFAVVVVSLTAFLTAYFLGPDLPSFLGGLIGLICLCYFASKSWLIPKTEWNFKHVSERSFNSNGAGLLKLLAPYFFLALILFLTRADFLPIESFLQTKIVIGWENILNTGLSYSFNLLYAIGTILFFSGLFLSLIFNLHKKDVRDALCQSISKIKRPFIALTIILIFTQIFIYSGFEQKSSMIHVLGQGLAGLIGPYWPFVSPLIGFFGSFIVGSATVSNLLLAELQIEAAHKLGLGLMVVLAGQGLGAAIGNMVAFHNIIAVASAVGLEEKEYYKIIFYNLPVAVGLALLTGIMIL